MVAERERERKRVVAEALLLAMITTTPYIWNENIHSHVP